MRRQTTTSGFAPAGLSRDERLNPLSLPARFEACDMRADGGIRHIELSRERVTLRRAVRGMRMAINIRVSDFLGVSLSTIDGTPTFVLKHRDPSLSIPLVAETDDVDTTWQAWSDTFSLPQLQENPDIAAAPAALRRRRRNAVKTRRPSILMRRKPGCDIARMGVFRGEREIIART